MSKKHIFWQNKYIWLTKMLSLYVARRLFYAHARAGARSVKCECGQVSGLAFMQKGSTHMVFKHLQIWV